MLLQYPGFGFQFLCNIVNNSFLSTLDGLAWQRRFLAGEAKASGTSGMVDPIHQMDCWREIGMLNADGTPDDDNATQRVMAQGNSTDVRNKANTPDEFNLDALSFRERRLERIHPERQPLCETEQALG